MAAIKYSVSLRGWKG